MEREKIIFMVGITFCFIGFAFASANITAPAWLFGGMSFIIIAYYIFGVKTVSK